jgi:hypothetical protein
MAYNGWSNYATWKVALEVFDGTEFEETVEPSFLEELAEEIIFGDTDRNTFVSNYAQSFLEGVDYLEIAEVINREILSN